MTQTVQMTTDIPQLQFPDQVVDVPLAFVVLVRQMQVVPETVEISQLDVVGELSIASAHCYPIHRHLRLNFEVSALPNVPHVNDLREWIKDPPPRTSAREAPGRRKHT